MIRSLFAPGAPGAPGAPAGADSAVPRRVWGATLLLALGRQWSALCAFLALGCLARGLELAEFGRFTFYLALFSLLEVLVDCGTSTVAVQRGAQGAAEFAQALAAGRRVRLGSSAVAAALVCLTGALQDPAQAGWVALAALSAFARVAELSAVVFQRDIAWGLPVALRALGATLRLAALASLVALGARSFGPYLAVHAGTLALGNVAIHFVARRRLGAATGASTSSGAAGMLRTALPLVAAGLCQQAYFYVDNQFVRSLHGDAAVGRYNAGMKLFSWLVFFAAFTTTTALPWLARRFRDGQLGGAVVRLAQPLLVLGCAAVGLLWPWSAEILRLVYGEGFVSAAPSLRWLLAAVLAVYAGAPFLTAVVATGRSRAVLAIAGLALLVNVTANALLVPRHGIEGAAGATVLTEGAVLLFSIVSLSGLRIVPRERPAAWLFAPLAFAATWGLSRAVLAGLVGR